MEHLIIKRMSGAVYLAALLMVLFPLGDLWVNILPLSPTVLDWRYGVVGLLSGFLLTPVIGLLIAVGMAFLAEQYRILSFLGRAAVVGGCFLVGLAVLFTVDALRLRGGVPGDQLGTFNLAVSRSLAKLLLTAVGVLWLGLAARDAGSSMQSMDQDPSSRHGVVRAGGAREDEG